MRRKCNFIELIFRIFWLLFILSSIRVARTNRLYCVLWLLRVLALKSCFLPCVYCQISCCFRGYLCSLVNLNFEWLSQWALLFLLTLDSTAMISWESLLCYFRLLAKNTSYLLSYKLFRLWWLMFVSFLLSSLLSNWNVLVWPFIVTVKHICYFELLNYL